MSWGHATSTDLTTWTDHPVVIEATDDELVFSGSVVVDRDNTSGLGGDGEPPLVAVYTSVYGEGRAPRANTQAQSLAYSTDGGATLGTPRGTPCCLDEPEARSFRDPKVFWYEPGGYWVMAAVVADARVVKLFRSGDLLDWQPLSEVGLGVDEGLVRCPTCSRCPSTATTSVGCWSST